LTYSNPYDYRFNSPALYFQPLTFLFGLILKLFPVDPGLVFSVFGFICTVWAFFILQILLQDYCPVPHPLRLYLLIIIAWGGGLFALAGGVSSFLQGEKINFLQFDPGEGHWFLNFGRNFIYPTEAFYHFLVLLLFLAVFRKKEKQALGLIWLLVLSHPFTGIQYSIILLVWIILERMFFRPQFISNHLLFQFSLPILFCLFYYLVFLPGYPSHRALMEQWSLDWTLDSMAIFLAYFGVGGLFFIRCATKKKFKKCFENSFNRFLLVSAGVSFLLAKHDILISPRQPIHFTRGHIWLPLCLLGLPLICDFWEKLRMARRRWPFFVLSTGFLFLALSDNLTFFFEKVTHPSGFLLSNTERKCFEHLAKDYDQSIVISDDPGLVYLTATYTSARPYYSHWANTPQAEHKKASIEAFFAQGVIPKELLDNEFLLITRNSTEKFKSDPRFRTLGSIEDLALFSYQG